MDSNDWKEINELRGKQWRAAIGVAAERWVPIGATWTVPSAILDWVNEYSFEPSKPRYEWKAEHVMEWKSEGVMQVWEAFTVQLPGLTMRIDHVSNQWHWSVFKTSDGRTCQHSALCCFGFPQSENWRDAITFAELVADFFQDQPDCPSLTYLQHVKPSKKARRKKRSSCSLPVF